MGNNFFTDPAPGDRAPYSEINAPEDESIKTTFDFFKKPGFHLFLFLTKNEIKENYLKNLNHLPLLHLHKIFFNKRNRNAFKLYNVKKEKWVLIRPDGYIACQDSFDKIERIEKYFMKWDGIVFGGKSG